MSRSLPPLARRSLALYNSLFALVFVLLLPGLLRRLWRRGNYKENFAQRFGRYGAEDQVRLKTGAWIWIHSISVGETLVALKLARAMRLQEPGVKIVVSVTTSTGFAVARQSPEVLVIYNPLDLPFIVRRAMDAIRPRQLVFIEGEAWPNLVAACVRRGIPTALVNARLSPRSESRFLRFKSWTGPIFALLDRICVPEAEDIARWQRLGVAPERLFHTGSLKFDEVGGVLPSRTEQFRALLDSLGVTGPILLAGSTWAPEESLLIRLVSQLRLEIPNLFLILVPRHVERCQEILAHAGNFQLLLRSALSSLPPTPPNAANAAGACAAHGLLVDSTGELRDWYPLATVVFVGKSMPGCSGGQNPAEPAALAKPVVFGPHMENFQALVSRLLAQRAAIQVTDSDQLLSVLRELFNDDSLRAQLSLRASACLEPHQGATSRTAALLHF